jgi:hypothetical protein
MQQRQSGSAAVVVIAAVAAVVLAVANVLMLLSAIQHATDAPTLLPLLELYRGCPVCLGYFLLSPLVFGIAVALLSVRAAAPAVPETQPVQPPPPTPNAALRLLALLQQEARFIDFLEEDIAPYSDEQVGAAVRSIHEGCRKALADRIQLARVFEQEDGAAIVVDKGFDPSAVRLTGNVSGEPPFRGTLQHGGWRAARVALPEWPEGMDPTILAPAEVEIA